MGIRGAGTGHGIVIYGIRSHGRGAAELEAGRGTGKSLVASWEVSKVYRLQAVVTELNDFALHYFERKGVESAEKKWDDVREKMKEAVDLLDSLEGVHCICVHSINLASSSLSAPDNSGRLIDIIL